MNLGHTFEFYMTDSGPIPEELSNSGAIPVDSGAIPADSGAIPAELLDSGRNLWGTVKYCQHMALHLAEYL